VFGLSPCRAVGIDAGPPADRATTLSRPEQCSSRTSWIKCVQTVSPLTLRAKTGRLSSRRDQPPTSIDRRSATANCVHGRWIDMETSGVSLAQSRQQYRNRHRRCGRNSQRRTARYLSQLSYRSADPGLAMTGKSCPIKFHAPVRISKARADRRIARRGGQDSRVKNRNGTYAPLNRRAQSARDAR